jgi:hypothetical protein
MVANGSAVPGTGIDGSGHAYSATLLGTSATWSGVPFAFGAAGTLNAVSSRTLTAPAGKFSKLYMLAAGVNGNQKSQTFVVTYTDGTTSTFSQGLSNWNTPQSFPGESIALTEAYRLNQNGTQDNRTFDIFGYQFAINNAKTISTIKLPTNINVVVLGLTLVP